MDTVSSLFLLFSTNRLVDVGLFDFTFGYVVHSTTKLPQQKPLIDVTEKQSLLLSFLSFQHFVASWNRQYILLSLLFIFVLDFLFQSELSPDVVNLISLGDIVLCLSSVLFLSTHRSQQLSMFHDLPQSGARNTHFLGSLRLTDVKYR